MTALGHQEKLKQAEERIKELEKLERYYLGMQAQKSTTSSTTGPTQG